MDGTDPTFLFTDIEGSTALWDKHPSLMGGVVARHDDILESSVSASGGRVVKMLGDGMYAVFEDPDSAVNAALSAMDRLESEAWPDPIALRVRMGIHTGPAQERAGDFFGPAVNRAARIGEKANGGQLIVSETTAGLIDEARLVADVAHLGAIGTKGFEQPIDVFQIAGPGMQHEFPPLRGIAAPHNLPAFNTSFVGRLGLVDLVSEALESSSLVTLVGPGGSGKTRLAVETGWRVFWRFPDGIWFVDLAELSDPELVADALARTASLSTGTSAEVAEGLRDKSALVILDNCEHLVEKAAELANLLAGTGSVKVLATSQQPLLVDAEHEINVPTLPHAGPDSESARLFFDRWRSTTGPEGPTETDRASVAHIVEALEGLPLAIELAASAGRAMAPADIARHLDTALAMESVRDARPHHATMRAALDWSYGLLAAVDQLVLVRCSVFIGNFSLQSAEAVATDEEIHPGQVFESLATLVNRSLVQRVPAGEDGIIRFRLLETTRAYARENLEARAETEAVRKRHAHLFVAATVDLEDKLRGPEQALWHLRMSANTSNILAALEWLDGNEPETALEAASQLGRLWYRRGLYDIGEQTLQRALDATGEDPTEARARALQWLGFFIDGHGDRATARELSGQALTVAEQIGSPQLVAFALNGLAGYSFDEGNLNDAADQWRAAVKHLDDAESEFVSAPLFNLGYTLVETGQMDEAADVARRLRRIGADSEDTFSQAMATLLESYAELGRGDYQAARRLAAKAEEGFEVAQSTVHVAEAILVVAEVSEVEGDIDAAHAEFERARELVGEGFFEGTEAYILRARIDLRGHDLTSAAKALRNELTAHRRDPNAANGVNLIHETARVAMAAGREDLAVPLMHSSVRLTAEHELRPKPYRLEEAAAITGHSTPDASDTSSLDDALERARLALDEI